MTQLFRIHPDNPQVRLLHQAVSVLNEGGVIAYPTDSGYALGCRVGDKEATERIRTIRKLSTDHNFTLVCQDLSELSTYAKIDKNIFKLLKDYTPGPYTFILPATREVPKLLQHPKRKTIGMRIPDNSIARAFLKELGKPLMSVTLFLPGEETVLTRAEDIYEKLDRHVDVILDGGYCGVEPTTVVDFVSSGDGTPRVTRVGKGSTAPFMGVAQAQHGNLNFKQIFNRLQK